MTFSLLSLGVFGLLRGSRCCCRFRLGLLRFSGRGLACLLRVLGHKSLGLAPKAHDTNFGRRGCIRGVSAHLVLLINLREELASLVDRFGNKLLSALCRDCLSEGPVHGLSTQLLPVVDRWRAAVLLVNSVSLLAVFAQKLKEALVAADLDHRDLIEIPGLVKKRLDVALILEVSELVIVGAIGADKGAEGDDAVRAPVVLAVDAVGVELLSVDAVAQVGTHVSTLHIAFELWLWHGWVAMRLGVCANIWVRRAAFSLLGSFHFLKIL